MMKLIGLLLLAVFAASAVANPLPTPGLSVRDRSGQFLVTGLAAARAAIPAGSAKPAVEMILLDPASLAVSCERVKAALLKELGAPDSWRGKIHIALRPFDENDREIVIKPSLYIQGWHYRVDIPDRMEPMPLMRALVQVLLLEMANRNAGHRSAEIPFWLSEGLAKHLSVSSSTPLLLRPESPIHLSGRPLNQSQPAAGTAWWLSPGLNINTRLPDPFQEARERLNKGNFLSFQELSRSADAALGPEKWSLFPLCAQVFVVELLSLPEGKARMLEMLRALPEYLNWQLAFLHAFQPKFQSLLDVEKWWAVTAVNFKARDRYFKWSGNRGLMRLDEVLIVPVEVRVDDKAIPDQEEMSIQSLIERLEYSRQKPLLLQTIQQLRVLLLTVPPDLFKLVDDYRVTLETYVTKRDKAVAPADQRGAVRSSVPLTVRETIQQLNLLDVLRGDFKELGAGAAAQP